MKLLMGAAIGAFVADLKRRPERRNPAPPDMKRIKTIVDSLPDESVAVEDLEALAR